MTYRRLGRKSKAVTIEAVMSVKKRIPNLFRDPASQSYKKMPLSKLVKAPPSIVSPICLKAALVLVYLSVAIS